MQAVQLTSVIHAHTRKHTICLLDLCATAAQVRLVKCMIDNIVVDISFNQLGGICTYGFLERVNNELIPNHLFKMSIILVGVHRVRIMQDMSVFAGSMWLSIQGILQRARFVTNPPSPLGCPRPKHDQVQTTAQHSLLHTRLCLGPLA